MNKQQKCMVQWQGMIRLLFLLSSALYLSAANAGSGRDLQLEKLLSRAELVVHGEFTQVDSRWQGKKIITVGSFRVAHLIKGVRQDVIEVEYVGGTAMHPALQAPVTMKVSDGVNFVQGEEAVLMLRSVPSGRYQIIGMSRGKISVHVDDSGEKHVAGFKKIQAAPREGSQQTTIRGEAMTLDEFISFARSLLQARGDNS